jgi:hypothetical protein
LQEEQFRLDEICDLALRCDVARHVG